MKDDDEAYSQTKWRSLKWLAVYAATMSTKTWEAAVGEELAVMPMLLVAFATSLLARAISCGGRH